jgi:hypothetical protein
MSKHKSDAAKRAAEILERDNVDCEDFPADPAAIARREAAEHALQEAHSVPRKAAEPVSDVVYVFANLQSGQSFPLPGGVVVTIAGMPVSRLKSLEGKSFPGGKFGVTRVPATQWKQVLKTYGKMRIFQNGLVFDAPNMERGKAMARERGALRHGYEPVNPHSSQTKTSPRTED